MGRGPGIKIEDVRLQRKLVESLLDTLQQGDNPDDRLRRAALLGALQVLDCIEAGSKKFPMSWGQFFDGLIAGEEARAAGYERARLRDEAAPPSGDEAQ